MRKIKTLAGQTVLPALVVLGILCLFFPAKASAQPSNNRWLFIFNTSSAMRDRTKGLLNVTGDLLTTGMHGNIRPGDTIGIWTYDSELRASEAPLQTWSLQARDSIAGHTIDFLRRHRYEKTASFGDVLTNMLRVVNISDTITVVLISDGSDSIRGTPFDASINAFYKTNFIKQRKADLPIVTVFRGEHGKITTNTLSLTYFANIPVVPPAPPAPKVVAQTPAPEAPKPVVPSLVMIGKKAQATTNTNNLPDITQGPDDAPVPAPAPIAAASTPAPTPAPVAAISAEPPKSAPVVQAETPKPALAPVTVPQQTSAAPTQPAPVAVAETPKPAAADSTAASSVQNWNTATPVFARESGTAAPVAPSPNPPAAEAAANASIANVFSARNIAIVSVAFSMLTCVLLIIVARNARRGTRASLITRSLDRENR